MLLPHDAVLLSYSTPAELVQMVLALQNVVGERDVYIVSPTTLQIAVSPRTMDALAL